MIINNTCLLLSESRELNLSFIVQENLLTSVTGTQRTLRWQSLRAIRSERRWFTCLSGILITIKETTVSHLDARSGDSCHETERHQFFGFVPVGLIYRWVQGDWWGLYGGGGRRRRASNSRPLVWQRVSKQGLHACGLGSCLWSAPLSIKLL